MATREPAAGVLPFPDAKLRGLMRRFEGSSTDGQAFAVAAMEILSGLQRVPIVHFPAVIEAMEHMQQLRPEQRAFILTLLREVESVEDLADGTSIHRDQLGNVRVEVSGAAIADALRVDDQT